MGINISKYSSIISPDFNGENDQEDSPTDPTLHPEWLLAPSDLPLLNKELKLLDSIPLTKTPLFSLKNVLTVGKCSKVYDGDTAHFIIRSPFSRSIKFIKLRCRFIGYNSPELITNNPEEKRKAIAARDYLASLVYNKNVLLYFHAMDKYGRPLTDVFIIDDKPIQSIEGIFDKHVNSIMVERGFGIKYIPKTIDSDDDD